MCHRILITILIAIAAPKASAQTIANASRVDSFLRDWRLKGDTGHTILLLEQAVFREVVQEVRNNWTSLVFEIDSVRDDFSIYYPPQDSLFTRRDSVYFEEQLKQLENFHWPKKYFSGVSLLAVSDMQRCFRGKNLDKGWKRFQKHHGPRYCKISVPIFNADGTLAIFFQGCAYGKGATPGSVSLYEQISSGWKLRRELVLIM